VLSQWSRGSCSVQLPYRCSNGLSKLVRPGNSSQLFAETCPPPVGLVAPRLPPEAAPKHRLTPLPAMGLSIPRGGRPATVLLTRPQDSLGIRCLTVAPPEPPEAGGQGTEGLGPAVGYFSQQQLNYWVAQLQTPGWFPP